MVSIETVLSPPNLWLSACAWVVLLLQVSSAIAAASETEPPHVVFFNPGFMQSDNPTGQFWPESTSFIQAVAEDLGVTLEVQHANRDSLRMQRQIGEVLGRPKRPDYLLLVNERFALSQQFRLINQAGIPFFSAYNHVTREGMPAAFPRETYRNWIGALVPDNHYAGYELAQRLISELEPTPAKFLILAGDNVTSAAKLRELGLQEALKHHSHARIVERIVGEWGYHLPRQKVAGLLRRHPEINVIWSANGAMARGALNAITTANPKFDFHPIIGSINWDSDEISMLQKRQLSTSIGGHFMTAGLSLVLIYDFHHGIDFQNDGGRYQRRRLFHGITVEDLQRYPILTSRHWRQLDFRRLSKHHSPHLDRYDFSINSLLGSDTAH
ncbi:MAG: hypothetical protein CL693_10780 [Cellvibrionaceae bacterium]|nr:hypothetical protein [Cellvibrionaceae bacterium]|tara:strand:+ start:18311 stop:19462 length:1152 start_codon:yes stop_codon:yes gene_type:complete